jgi:hypothetical protein
MNAGNIAAAAGMPIVPGTASVRNAFAEINISRDLLATHQSTGTHDASAVNSGQFNPDRIPALPADRINSGQFDPARIPVLPADRINSGQFNPDRIPNLPGSKISGFMDLGIATLTASDVTVTSRVIANNATLGNTSVTGPLLNPPAVTFAITGARRTAWLEDASGRLGFAPSSRASKQNIAPHQLQPADLAALEIVTFRYKDQVKQQGAAAATEVGLIADDVAAAGLDWLVIRDADGNPQGIQYDLVALAALALAQDNHRRLQAIETRITAIEQGATP